MIVIAMAVGWAVWMRKIWWPLGWDTLLGVIYEAGLFFIFKVFSGDIDALGCWKNSERIAFAPLPKRSTIFLGVGCLSKFALGPPDNGQFMRHVWSTIPKSHVILNQG
jgi:hypothetical protein